MKTTELLQRIQGSLAILPPPQRSDLVNDLTTWLDKQWQTLKPSDLTTMVGVLTVLHDAEIERQWQNGGVAPR